MEKVDKRSSKSESPVCMMTTIKLFRLTQIDGIPALSREFPGEGVVADEQLLHSTFTKKR